MKFTITVSDCTAEEAKAAIAALTGGKATSVTADVKAPAKGKGKKTPPPAEEVEEEEVSEDESEEFVSEEESEDEPDFDAEPEEDEAMEEEEEVTPPKKGKVAPAGKTAPAVSIDTVVKAFQATKKALLAKKGATEEKVNGKLNALLKKHGSKSIKGLKPALLAAVLKDVKALAA